MQYCFRLPQNKNVFPPQLRLTNALIDMVTHCHEAKKTKLISAQKQYFTSGGSSGLCAVLRNGPGGHSLFGTEGAIYKQGGIQSHSR